MRRFLAIALILLSLPANWVAGAESDALATDSATDAGSAATAELLATTFKSVLEPEQFGKLGAEPSPERMVEAMLPEQKEAARAQLKKLEETTKAPAQLAEIERGYSLLGASADLFRVGMRRKGLLGEDVSETTAAASRAYDEGRKEDAVRLAAEALARNPDDKAAFAIFMLAKPKVQPKALNLKDPFGGKPSGGIGDGAGAATPLEPSAARPTSPEAQAIMRRVVEARRAGNLDATLGLALDAMRADPTSPTVQKLYLMVIEDRSKQLRRVRQTVGFLEQAMDAERAGDRDRAVALAEQAAAVDPHPTVLKIVQELRSRPRSASKEAKAAAGTPEERRKGLPPLAATAAVMAGVLLLAWAATPKETKEHFKRALWDNPRQELKYAAVAGAVCLAAWQLGPPLAAAAKAMLAAPGPSAQGLQFASAGVGGGGAAIPALSWAETATAAVKAGAISILARAGFRKAAEQYSYAKSQGGGTSTTEPPRGESASPNAQDSLDRKLRALEQAQKDAEHVRNLPDGRVRYYGPETPAQTPGPTRGRRMVTEFDSKTGQVRQWMENYDHSGKVVRVHPKMIDGQVVQAQHYPPTGKELAP